MRYVIAGGLYCAVGLLAYWNYWVAGGTRVAGKSGDLATSAWFLGWVWYAISHGHNPLLTDWGNYPAGVNLLANTSTPLLGLLGAPVTAIAGAFFSLTLWFTLAFPLSALAAYALIRRWVRWEPAAFAGGLLYGFSPYMVSQGLGHLNLVFVPLPPLIFLALSRIAAGQDRGGALLTALCVAQFFVSPEVLASTVIIGAIGVAAAGVKARVVQPLWKPATVATLLLAYPAWLMVAGPGHVTGPVQGTAYYRGNLLAPVIPGSAMHFRVAGLLGLANTFSGNTSENGLYLGIPLLVLVAGGAFWLRRNPVMRVAGITTIAAFVLSLGSRLTVGRHVFRAVPLPEAALTRIPVLDNTIAARYSLYVMLGVAVLLALVLQALRERAAWPVPLAICGAVLLPLVPAWPYSHPIAQVPRYFAAADGEPGGGVAVLYPFPSDSDATPMLWQVSAGFRFKTPGGRFIVPGSSAGSLTQTVFGAVASGRPPGMTAALRTAVLAQ